MRRESQQIILKAVYGPTSKVLAQVMGKRGARLLKSFGLPYEDELRKALRRMPEPSAEKLKEMLQELPLFIAGLRKDLHQALGELAPRSRRGQPSKFSTNEKKREALNQVKDLVFDKKYKVKLALEEVANNYGVSLRTMERIWAERDLLAEPKSRRKGAKQ